MQRRDEEEDEYPDELYDMYRGSNRNSRSSKGNGRSRMQSRYEEEESQYASEYDEGSFDEDDFEMMSSRGPSRYSRSSRAPSRAPSSSRGASRRPEIRKIRVKVHAEDTRYIMIGTAIEFPDLMDRVREKFGMRKRFKIKMRDEDMPNGDMITMADQDDLDMAIMAVKANARKEKLDMGKFEVSFRHISCMRILLHEHSTDPPFRSGSKRSPKPPNSKACARVSTIRFICVFDSDT
jgi:hypothetical protein